MNELYVIECEDYITEEELRNLKRAWVELHMDGPVPKVMVLAPGMALKVVSAPSLDLIAVCRYCKVGREVTGKCPTCGAP